MKKSELTQLTQIIEHLVRKELRKQLPGIIAETFQNMMGRQTQPIVESQQTQKDYIGQEVQQPKSENPNDFKLSMRDLFEGTSVITSQSSLPRAPRQLAKDPVLNSILNQTRPFNSQEKMAMGGGPGVMMAMAQMPTAASSMSPISMTGVGEMMPDAEIPSVSRMPVMPGLASGVPVANPPVLVEGRESTHAPMESLPSEISALDVARAGMVSNPAVTQALTNFDRMKKILQQSKGPRH